MESIIATLIIITLVLTGGLMMAQRYLSSQERLMQAWLEMERAAEERLRTEVAAVASETKSSGAVVDLTLANSGLTKLADYETWDVIVQYESVQGYRVVWLPYVTGEPGQDEWSVDGIYLDAVAGTAEIYDPGIFDSGEELVARLRLSPPVKVGSTNLARVVTPNGVAVSVNFTR